MKFKGTDSPEIYIIDDKVHDEDRETDYPMSGDRGNYVLSILGSMELLDKTRFANWEGHGPEVVREDILRCSPKIIVGFGSNLMQAFVVTDRKITDVSGEIFDIKINDTTFKFLVVMSPSYVLHQDNNQELALKFCQDLYKASQVVNGTYYNPLDEKEVLSAHSFEEFEKIYNENFKDEERLSYDIETNAKQIYTEGSRIIGFSVANKNVGVYVSVDSLDFTMSPEEEDRIWDLMKKEVFDKHKLIIHNTMYERPYTLHCKNYEIKYDQADDTLVMARLLRGAGEGAGLKYQAQKNVHYPDWETGLSRYISGFRGIVSRGLFGLKKFSWIIDYVKSGESIFNIINNDNFISMNSTDQEEIRSYVDQIKSPIVDLYDCDELLDVGERISEKFVTVLQNGGIEDSTIPYNWIPDRLLSQYGAVDSLATYDLCEYFESIMDKESNDKIDLHRGYHNWLEHMYVAYVMERNGLHWDEETAKKDEISLHAQATRSLRDMILSPVFEDALIKLCSHMYKPLILSDFLPTIASSQGFEVEYDKVTDRYTVKKDGKRANKDSINWIEIPDGYQNQYNDLVRKMVHQFVESSQDYEELKGIYNPASSTQSWVAREILMTDDVRMGCRINELHTLATSPGWENVIDKLPIVDQKFLKIASMLCDADKLKEDYGNEWSDHRKEIYQGFLTIYSSLKDQVRTPEIKKILNDKDAGEIESFDDGGIISIYDNLVVTGMDPDDEKSWTPTYKWMMDFRLFKKSQKLIASYINGTIGRQSVVVVDKKSHKNGEPSTRESGYVPNVSSDKDYLLAARWSPNVTVTGRWKSGFHTIPWGSQVKKYYPSRFTGGTILMPDYSQMEVRSLAAISQDENMIELFRENRDFHTETAKKVFRKDEVTQAERRYSKTATFSILYGAVAQSFANSYCGGDIDYANQIYDGFFSAYPKVKEWVDQMHEEVMRDHRVSLELANRYINIPSEGDSVGAINSIKRKAQNFPIQGTSADITGCVIFDLQQFIEENNMKSLIIMYVHDSIEVDVYPYELIKILDKMKFLLNDSPMRRMGLPSKADVALGKSLGHEIEMESIEYNEDMTDGVIELKGFQDEIYETIDTWKKAYKTVEILEESYKELYVSWGELFILRKAFTPTLGVHRHKGTCKVHINYYK